MFNYDNPPLHQERTRHDVLPHRLCLQCAASLNRNINHAHGLLPALLATGYRVNDRHFTRRQVQLIFEYLGEP